MPQDLPILSRTSNFFRLYHHICGESEVPTVYHFWCCVALLSACLEDRCWFELYKGNPIKPNLYIGLIGPGSLGKGMAMSQAIQLAQSSIQLQVYRGKVTYAHLIDRLGKSYTDEWGRKILANPRLWLVMDELKDGVGAQKNLNEEFISLMTELYTAVNYDLSTGTRTHGEVTVQRPLLNWLFGSTEVWLRQVLTRDVFESGFVARACMIFADYNLDLRIPRIKYPKDHDEVYRHLQTRLWMVQSYQGPFLMTPTAEAEFDSWYHRRPAPEDEMLYSAWMRQKEMLIRFAMINCVADGQEMIIRHGHLVRSAHMVKQLEKFTARLIQAASESYDSKPIGVMEKYLAKKGRVAHSYLLKYMRSLRGYDAAKTKKSIDQLRSEGSIDIERNKTGGVVYVWKKGS